MRAKNKAIYRKSYALDEDKLKELTELKNSALEPIVTNFHNNMQLVAIMVSLPTILISMKHMEFHNLLVHLEARLKSGVQDLKMANEEDKRKFYENAKKIWEVKYEPKKNELITDSLAIAEENFSEMTENPQIYEPYRSLLYAGIVFTWCSFEVFMKDLLETALNVGNKLLTKTTLRNIGKVDKINSFYGLQGKYINLEYLAQYNYDISDKLGSILINKFDFTSLYGIKEAYSCVFPRSTAIKEALESKELLKLEARRHIIVHKAGVIDVTYCKNTDTSSEKIGSKLEISDEELFEFGNTAINTAIRVIKAVSSVIYGGKEHL